MRQKTKAGPVRVVEDFERGERLVRQGHCQVALCHAGHDEFIQVFADIPGQQELVETVMSPFELTQEDGELEIEAPRSGQTFTISWDTSWEIEL